MISVVIPCYNRSRLLHRAIDSALAQTVRASEVIVVDDGSTDNTKDSVLTYGNRIEYVWQQNAGPSVARNTGAKHARSSWVAFLDSDDYWTAFHLARMVKAIEKTRGEARFYFSDMQMGEDNECTTLWQTINFAPPHPVHLTKDGTNWAFLRRQPFMLQCSVFRRDVWMESGGLDQRFRLIREDTELFFRLSIGGKICAVSGVGCVQTDDDVSNVRLTTAVNPRRGNVLERINRVVAKLTTQLAKFVAQISQNRTVSFGLLLLATYSAGVVIGKSGRERMAFACARMDRPFFRNLTARIWTC